MPDGGHFLIGVGCIGSKIKEMTLQFTSLSVIRIINEDTVHYDG